MSIVTCHTPGCGNAGIDIDMELTIEIDGEPTVVDQVVCGVCNQPITDVRTRA